MRESQARKPLKRFSYNAERDGGHGTNPSQGGYPSCKTWWSNSDDGVRDRLKAQLDTAFQKSVYSTFPSNKADEYTIRGLLNNRAGSAHGNAGTTGSGGAGGNWFTSTLGTVGGMLGVGVGTLPSYGMQSVAAHALPKVQYLVLMAIVMAMPLVIVFSGYSFEVVGLLTFAYFGVISLDFWFQLSHWLQNHLTDLVYDSEAAKMGYVAGLGSVYDQGVLGLVKATLMFVFPPLWMGMLSWAGYSVGTGISTSLTKGGDGASSAGKEGGKKGQNETSGGKV
ncbi:hypothetical protein HKX42_05855 [Salinisphaera sp. USBA-960]|nr:hypothetical protein [Salifodinibacter halophilus]NNC26396.1 hypothetical protein [Salifodinibacter halophilus]